MPDNDARVAAIEAAVTRIDGEQTKQNTLLAGLRRDLAALQAAAITTTTIGSHVMERTLGVTFATDEHDARTIGAGYGGTSGATVNSTEKRIYLSAGQYRVEGWCEASAHVQGFANTAAIAGSARSVFVGGISRWADQVSGQSGQARDGQYEIDGLFVVTGSGQAYITVSTGTESSRGILYVRRLGDA